MQSDQSRSRPDELGTQEYLSELVQGLCHWTVLDGRLRLAMHSARCFRSHGTIPHEEDPESGRSVTRDTF